MENQKEEPDHTSLFISMKTKDRIQRIFFNLRLKKKIKTYDDLINILINKYYKKENEGNNDRNKD